MQREYEHEGWFFKKGGITLGPVSTRQVQELLASGQITPRHAVWRQIAQGSFFVTAATAIKDYLADERSGRD
jgi:hypothetical protein